MMKIEHNNRLRSKIHGEYSQLIKNSIGVIQGSPPSAYIFIIYSDHIMNRYSKNKKC